MSIRSEDDTDTVGNIDKFLQQCLEGMESDHSRKGPGRPRVLPAMALWAGLLVCVLRGFESQLAVWRLISERGLWFFPRFPVTDQAVYKRLHTAGTKPLERLFEQISSVLAERLQGVVSERLAPFAKDVVCIDESTLDAMSRTLPTLRGVPKGDSRLLPGKLAGAFDVRRQQWRTVKFQPNPQQNEKVLARDLVAELSTGTLVVADLGYFGFAWFDWLTDRGYYWLSRLRAKTSYKVIHTFYHRGDVFGRPRVAGSPPFRPGQARRSDGDFQTGQYVAPLHHQRSGHSCIPDCSDGRGLRSQVGHRTGTQIGQAAPQAAPSVVRQVGGDPATDMGVANNLADSSVDAA